MDSLKAALEQFFAALDGVQLRLSERWRLHANRRTIIVLVILGTLSTYAWVALIQAPDNFPIDKLVSVPQGETLSQIAQTLYDDGVIRSPFAFRVLMTLFGTTRTAQAGDYLFKEPRELFSIARAMSVGAFGLEPARIRVPEGATVKEMAAIFSVHLERFNKENFLAQAQPQEGYLFPDTYFFLPNADEGTVIQTLRQNFDSKITSIAPLIASSTRSVSDIVVMASILEREAYNTADRKMISGVLWNRIRKGMPLQVDVTFAYTHGKGTFQITMKDLVTPSAYNTYINKGLPPTPIGNPSLDSLVAAAVPTKNDYLYFLADRRGVTHFCKNYACQLANKARYF
ncbi:MAG: endolytic transglycosylase MltG [Patescibacteria group bacterium]